MMNSLILASSFKDRLTSWKQGVSSLVSTISIIDRLDTLRDDVVRIKPQLLLLDFDLLGLDGSNDTASLKRLSTETKIIILGAEVD